MVYPSLFLLLLNALYIGILGGLPYGGSTKDAQNKWNHFPAGMVLAISMHLTMQSNFTHSLIDQAPTSPTSSIPDANKPRASTTSTTSNNPPNLLVPSMKPKQTYYCNSCWKLHANIFNLLSATATPIQSSPPLSQALGLARSMSPTKQSSLSLSTSTAPIPVPSNVGVPKSSKFLTYLQHGGVVCAVAFNHINNNVYTCGKVSNFSVIAELPNNQNTSRAASKCGTLHHLQSLFQLLIVLMKPTFGPVN